MRVGSLFSGIGGFELGLEWAGMKTVWQVENDPYAQRVLAKHWPDVARYGDIRTFNAVEAGEVDLICGGFPCQPHSSVGKRKASQDERDLWGEFAKVIREAKPRWVVAENVRGLLSSETGRFYGGILRDLASLGYDVEWFVFSAKAVGAPHRRDRVFIVAHANGSQCKGMGIAGGISQEKELSFDGRGKQIDWQPREWWTSEPDVDRVAHGISRRVDRLRCLGNAVVPQCSYEIGKIIMQADANMRRFEQ